MPLAPSDKEHRQRWMRALALAPLAELETAWAAIPEPPRYDWLRRPEEGMILVRGSVGGQGAPFNLGEMLVTRCAVRLATGEMGVAYLAGRNARQAELAAVFDALLQRNEWHDRLAPELIAPLEAAERDRRKAAQEKVSATRVEFFTLATGREAEEE